LLWTRMIRKGKASIHQITRFESACRAVDGSIRRGERREHAMIRIGAITGSARNGNIGAAIRAGTPPIQAVSKQLDRIDRAQTIIAQNHSGVGRVQMQERSERYD